MMSTKARYNFMKCSKYAFSFSAALSILIIFLLYAQGLNLGVDFTGGVMSELAFTGTVYELRDIIEKAGYGSAAIQETDSQLFIARIYANSSANLQNISEAFSQAIASTGIEIRKIDYVSPKIGDELILNAAKATVLALCAMMLYIWTRFSWQYGVGVLVALIHDAIATLGLYQITGLEFDLTSIAAILTIIGYSINDSVVIYDRVRYKLDKIESQYDLKEIINISINETMSRTIMTVLTTVVVCLALVFWGGHVLFGFSAAVLFGILFGTYSSIFISAPLLLYTKVKPNHHLE